MFRLAALPSISTRTMLNTFTATTLLCVASMSNAALFEDNLPTDPDAVLSVGVNAMSVKSAYDLEDDTEINVLPGAFYDNNLFYIRGAQAGAYVINNRENQLSAYVKLAGSEFDPDDATDELAGLDERKSSAEAGLSYQRNTSLGAIRAQIGADVLDRSGGNTARLTYLARITKGNLTVYPSIGFEYHDDDYNEYYYGVSDEESAETGVDAYRSDASLNPYVSVSANYDFNEKWAGFFNQSVSYLPNEQYDSPMVDSRVEAATTLGLLYKF
ncbi:MipA/OmpV family protein [Psychrobacter sp. AOP7-B1-24]|uniref:MipA/OmpV family protein n=1 Tax=Psychrobacter sp. AOP7-B1-24 TaxID=3457645 RepID=UPI00402B0F5F